MTETQALVLAFAWGCLFDWFITRFSKTKYDGGLTAIWVVIGITVTLLISSLVHVSLPRLHFIWLGQPLVMTNQQHAAIYEFKFLAAAGLPMVIGSLRRFLAMPLL